MIKKPPNKEELPPDPWKYIVENEDNILGYLPFYQSTDDKGKYFHFDEFRHRVPKSLDVNLAWALTKEARNHKYQFISHNPQDICAFVETSILQKTKTIVDQYTTTAGLEWTSKRMGRDQHFQYLLKELIEDESISSSQLEGAVTTTLVAKDMLKRKREPRNLDEKMIIGNFNLMRFAWAHRASPLTSELIKEFHFIGVDGIDNDKYSPGAFRITDDVVVEDRDGNIVHQPPLAEGLEARCEYLCAWVNADHDDIESNNFIHPLIKAIYIHFAIGYEHPFMDGNGRVARALFYWFMFKKEYSAFQYISISSLLKEAATQYGKSYLYTETDEMDLTYFIDYQCSIILRAVSSFKKHCEKIVADIESFDKWAWQSGVYQKLNDKQKTIFSVAKSGIAKEFTVTNVKENLNCSYNTAASVLSGLVNLLLFDKRKEGKEWIYFLKDKRDLQTYWVSLDK